MVTRGGQQGNARATGSSGDHGGRHVELAEQRGERVGLHGRLRRSGEADVGLAAVRPVPDEHLVAALGERLGELPDPGIVLAEPAAGRDHPGAALTDDLVREIDNPSTVAVPWPDPNLDVHVGQRHAHHRRRLALDASRTTSSPSAAPAEYRDRVPRVEDVDGEPMWVFDGNVLGQATAAGVIGRDGKKESADLALNHWTIDQIHVGAYDPKVRLEVLDECGIDAQVIFPSTIGLGGQDFGSIGDDTLSRMAIEIYNDRMADIQRDSGNRLLPDAVDARVAHRPVHRRSEARRRARRCVA